MIFTLKKYWPIILTILGLAAIVIINIIPYSGNVTSFFHLDALVAAQKPVPKHFVVLQVPAYDGAHYYQIARDIPLIFQPSKWDTFASRPTLSYTFQRILLPTAAYIVSFGQEPLLPYAFLLINLSAIVAAGIIILRFTKKPLYALAIAFCPSAMVALHFSLAEPLTLFILALFLTGFIKRGEKLQWSDIILLSLLPLSREVNILFIGFLGAYFLLKKNWKDALFMSIPVAIFLAYHGLIYEIFNTIPFLTSAGNRTFPFAAILGIVFGAKGYNHLTLTSIPLFLFFVLPGIIWTLWLIVKKRDWSVLTLGTFVFFLLMSTMPDFIWGSITSIGRVITPVYPLCFLLCAKYDSPAARFLSCSALLLGLAAGLSLALNPHPFIFAS